MPIAPRRATSAADLKALGHPLRLALLDLLMEAGPLTATDAAGSLAQTPANVSWHLRRLAEHGFVRQATGGPGRRRPWKVVAEAVTVNAMAERAGSSAELTEVQLEREIQLLRGAIAAGRRDPGEPSAKLLRRRLSLSAQELSELGRDLDALLASYEARLAGPDDELGQGPRVRIAIVSWLVPLGESAQEVPGSD